MTKIFEIKGTTESKHLPETFEVNIEFMHGDADAYTSITVGPFSTDESEALSSLVETLDRVAAAYPNGRGGNHERYGFQHIGGFESWFGTSIGENEEQYNEYYKSNVPYEVFAKHYKLRGERYPDWPWDVTGAEVEADLEKYKVVFYDADLNKHKVKIVDA